MEQPALKTALVNILKTPILRNILLIALGSAMVFQTFSFIYIFPRFTHLLTASVEDHARRLAAHLEETVTRAGAVLPAQAFRPGIRQQILTLLKDMELEQIKIFSDAGQVVYSSNTAEEGTWNTHEYFRSIVSQGRVYAKQVKKDQPSLEGRTVTADVLEIYVPVMTQNKFSGAIEIYYNNTKNHRKMVRLVSSLKLIMTIFTLLAVGIVLVVLNKASRHILNRQAAETALRHAHDALEQTVADRTSALKAANLALMDEIHNHKISDKALRKSEKRLIAILEANPDPMVVMDTRDCPQYLNPAFTALFGWTLDELQGLPIPFVPDDRKERDALKESELYRTGRVTGFETVRLTKTGQPLDVLISTAITKDDADKPAGMVQNITDITEKKRLDTKLRQAQKLESIGTLAGGIAHDFNNILTGIFGHTQLAKINLNDPVRACQDLDMVLNASQRATELVRQILAFSRQSEYQRQPFKPGPLVREVLKLIRASFPATIEIREAVTAKGHILADHSQIHQVIMNLCTNAFQAMQDKGGTLSVSLSDIRVPGPGDIPELKIKPGDYLRLSVTDTGHGMDEKTLEKIFDPYFTTKPQGQGTGLGLAVVHGIVQEHGGHIHVTSEPGRGAEFLVLLPASQTRSRESRASEGEETDLPGSGRIMLVDDETHIRSSVMDYFSDRGYDVHPFADGTSALDAFYQCPGCYDCLITDLTMPGLTGERLAKAVLELRPELPVIFFSGYSEALFMEKTRMLGPRKFIPKPFRLKELLEAVRAQLDVSPPR